MTHRAKRLVRQTFKRMLPELRNDLRGWQLVCKSDYYASVLPKTQQACRKKLRETIRTLSTIDEILKEVGR